MVSPNKVTFGRQPKKIKIIMDEKCQSLVEYYQSHLKLGKPSEVFTTAFAVMVSLESKGQIKLEFNEEGKLVITTMGFLP